MFLRLLLLFLILAGNQLTAANPISAKSEAELAHKLGELFRSMDREPVDIIDLLANYEEYAEFLTGTFKDENHELRQRFSKATAEKFHGYQLRKISQIKNAIEASNLDCKSFTGAHFADVKEKYDGFLRRGKLKFQHKGREINVTVDFCYYKKKFYPVGMKNLMVQYQKDYVEPLRFTSTLWNTLPPKIPTDKPFYYPEMNEYASDERPNNVTVHASPEVENVLLQAKTPRDSPVYDMIDLNQDTSLVTQVFVMNQSDTLFASSINYTLKKYKMGDFINWVPVSLDYEEIKNDSVVYQVESDPSCSKRGNYLFFDCGLTLNFGQYNNAKPVHNGARTYGEITHYILNEADEFHLEVTRSEFNEEFSNQILKSIFQVSGDLEVLVVNNVGQKVTAEFPTEKIPIQFQTSEPIEVELNDH